MTAKHIAIRTAAAAAALLAVASGAHAYTTSSAISASRSFSAQTVGPGDTVTVTITVELDAIGADPVRGFFLSDHIPLGLSPSAGTVTLGGSPVTAALETGEAGTVYPGCTTSRWVTETPPTWSQGIPIPASSTLVVSYQVTVPADATNGPLTFPGFTWVAMIPTLGSAGDHFGYEDAPATLTVQGGVEPGDPDAAPGDPGAVDNGELQGGCATGGHATLPVLLVLLALFPALRRRPVTR